jgi:transposase-like protein
MSADGGDDGSTATAHKMRNILEKARKRDYDEIKAGAQAIYQADGQAQAQAAFRRFRVRKVHDKQLRSQQGSDDDLNLITLCGGRLP